MKTRRLVFAAALFGAVLPAAAQPTGFLLDPRLGYVSPSGSVQVSTSAAFGSTAAFDTKSDLGYKGQSDFLPGIRYVAERYRFEMSYQTSSFQGSLASAAVPLARRALSTSPVYTSLDVRNFGLSFRYDVYKQGGFSAGLGSDVEDVSFTTYTRDAAGGSLGTADSRQAAPLLTLGANLTDRTGRFFLDLQGGWFRWTSFEMQKGRIEAGWSFAKHSGLKVGAETLRYRDQTKSALSEQSDLRLSNVSGGIFFNF